MATVRAADHGARTVASTFVGYFILDLLRAGLHLPFVIQLSASFKTEAERGTRTR